MENYSENIEDQVRPTDEELFKLAIDGLEKQLKKPHDSVADLIETFQDGIIVLDAFVEKKPLLEVDSNDQAPITDGTVPVENGDK